MKQRVVFVLALITAALGLTLSGCSSDAQPGARLRVAVLPILDSLPLYVADVEGFFAEEGIDATAKLPEEGYSRGWPEVVSMDPDVKARIDALWDDLGI